MADSPQLDQITANFRDTVAHFVTVFRDDLATGVSSERLQARLCAELGDSALNRPALAAIAGAAIAQLAAALPVLDTTKDTEIAALRAALDAVAAEHEHTYLDVHYRQCAENVAAYARCDTCGNLPNGTLHCPTLAAASLRGEQ